MPLLTVVLGIGGALLGADIGANASINTTKENIQATKDKESRDKRSEVYLDFLEKANSYDVASQALRTAQEAATASGRVVPSAVEQAWQHARYEFRGAENAVSIYGSRDGWNMAIVVISTLPNAAPPEKGFPKIGATEPSAITTFDQAYTWMLHLTCREVPAAPRPNCDEI